MYEYLICNAVYLTYADSVSSGGVGNRQTVVHNPKPCRATPKSTDPVDQSRYLVHTVQIGILRNTVPLINTFNTMMLYIMYIVCM